MFFSRYVVTKAALECPARSMRSSYGSGYASLVEHLMQFKSLGHMSVIFRLDDGNGIETMLMRHQEC